MSVCMHVLVRSRKPPPNWTNTTTNTEMVLVPCKNLRTFISALYHKITACICMYVCCFLVGFT